MAVVKAVKKAKKKKQSKKQKESHRIKAKNVYEIIAETLQHNSDGEFDLPAFLVQYLDRSHPKFALGLHREFYVPINSVAHFYPKDTKKAEEIYHNQASIVMGAFGEGIKVREKRFDLPLCSECE